MPDPAKLAQSHTLAELQALEQNIRADPANRNKPGSFNIFTPKAQKKLDDIAWAITHKLRELREARGETVNDAGYTGRNRKK